MNYHVITFSQEESYLKKFLELPGRLYTSRELTQNPEEERQILTGTHVLSHYFTVLPLLVLNDREEPVSRAVLTVYPEDPTACLGFFESQDTEEAAALLFMEAERLAKKHKCTGIQGPIDASFWIRYRFKTNHFGRPYTGEPSNKDYYPRLWTAFGYKITDRYYSNRYRPVDPSHRNQKFASRLAEKRAEGYVIQSPSSADFDRTLREVYGLLIELYRHFPSYRRITEEEFVSLYCYLRRLIRYPMVKMAYRHGQPVGFFISIPDYQNTVYGKLRLMDYLRILLTRLHPRSYVMLYMGIDSSHRGLGKAMAEAIREELLKAGVPSTGALIRQGNVNKDYFRELVESELEYVLLRKDLSVSGPSPRIPEDSEEHRT